MSLKNTDSPSEFERQMNAVAEEDKIHERRMRKYLASQEGKKTMKEIRDRMAWVVSLSHAEFASDDPELNRFHLDLFSRAWQILLNAGLEPHDKV